ncbi:hypothetical protein Nepgr_001808 [Nepenthes gracilis]|uniref:UBA domain-containing protein n=1 Tax=Nepenthes gracilis TaxID=150966 RepID=A0AAD3P538_NEPGR|nr:hypothetical protein Nepgr_001808 [Nepenthes gracilis]
MSSTSKSKTKDKRAGKEQNASSKASGTINAVSCIPASAYNPILGTFYTLDTSSTSSVPCLNANGRFRNIDESDDHSGSTPGSGVDYDSASNNDSRSVESEEHKEKTPNVLPRQETIPGTDNDKREKIRQKNEKKHQRQKERRAQELHERCSSYLMSRKLEALSQQLVGMGFSAERATAALILNEGRVEEAVAWLFDGGEDADKQADQNLDTGGNLKIDISAELAWISEMESRFQCSKQEVERAIVLCEGDLDKAEENLRAQKQDSPATLLKSEETVDPSTTVSNVKISPAVNHSSVRPQPKPISTGTIQQRRDEKDFNYTKTAITVGSAPKFVNKSVQPLTRIQPRLEWARQQQMGMATEKRWPGGGSSPSVSYSSVSPLQVPPPSAKTESCYVSVGGEYKALHQATVREPVVVMQRPQSVNAKQAPVSSLLSSSPATGAGWYSSSSEIIKSNGLLPHIPSSRSLSPNNLGLNNFYHQPHYQQQHQQFIMSGGSSLDTTPLTSRGNPSWGKTGTSSTLAAASSLGLFSGLGSTGSSGSTSPVDWNTGGSIPSCDYTNIDWSLDRSVLPTKPDGLWLGLGSIPKSNHPSPIYDSNGLVMGVKPAMRPPSSNGSAVSMAGLQDGRAATADTSAAGSHEWTSPFEGKDLFSLPRQFVSSPSL